MAVNIDNKDIINTIINHQMEQDIFTHRGFDLEYLINNNQFKFV